MKLVLCLTAFYTERLKVKWERLWKCTWETKCAWFILWLPAIFGFGSAGDFSALLLNSFALSIAPFPFISELRIKLYPASISDLCCRFSGDRLDCQGAEEKIIVSIYILMGISIALALNNLGEKFSCLPWQSFMLITFQGHPDKEIDRNYAKEQMKQVRWHLFLVYNGR